MPTILIIEDEKDIREMARVVLAQQGYTVLAESNAQAGIAVARRQRPDLILMDIRLPQLDGWTATRVIKSDLALAHIPVVAWTALPMRGGESGARAAGYDGYLPKPIDPAQFADQVAAFLPERLRQPKPPQPAAQEPSAPSFQRIASPAYPEARLLLIANGITRQEIRQHLASAGYHHLLEATSMSSAIEAAAAHPPDLILLDLETSGADSQALRQARSDPRLSAIPMIVIASSLADHIETAFGSELSAEDCILKPIKGEELVARVSSRLRIEQLQDRLSRQQADLAVLYSASQFLSASLDPPTVMTMILEQAVASVGATGGGLYLLDANRRLVRQLHTGSATDLPPEKFKAILEHGAADWAISHLEPVLISDTFQDPRWFGTGDKQIRSALIVPLVGREAVPGVLVLGHSEAGRFTQEHVTLLSALAAQAAIALDNSRLFEQARDERQKSLAILDSSADAVVVVNNDMRITLVNAVAEQVLGLGADAVGQPVKDALATSSLLGLFDLAVLREGPVSLELGIHAGIYHASVRPVPGIGHVALLHDIHLLKEVERMELERERQEAERVRREFARHMSPRVVELLLKHGETLRQPRKCQAAVLFSDLRNYSALTERIGVEAIMEYVLKRYIAVMTDMIYAQEGTIGKLLGDGIMAVFGVPFPQADTPQRALRTAMIMLRALTALRAGWLRDLNQDISMGVGLAWGEVIAGDIGSSQLVDYTVIGDPVNMASRLGEMASPGEVLVSQTLAEAVGGDGPVWRLEALPPMVIKGKDLPQQIYRAVPIWPGNHPLDA